MTSSCIPRNYYLLVHDALRKVVGTEATLAAFVKHKHKFQCDMLVNSKMTDVEGLRSVSSATSHPLLVHQKSDSTYSLPRHTARENENNCNNTTAGASVDGANNTATVSDDNEQHRQRVTTLYSFVEALQKELPLCVISPHTRRLDITFPDFNIIQLALGADLESVGNLQSAAEINTERNWWKRNRLRISLGYDEELFIEQCPQIVSQAAIKLDRATRSSYERKRHEALKSEECKSVLEEFDYNFNVIIPPFTYWLAHCYSANLAFEPESSQRLLDIVLENYKEYYGIFAFDNPYCPGEDLNSMNVVRWLCDPQRSEYKVDASTILQLLNSDSISM